jgi:hypothetical protein
MGPAQDALRKGSATTKPVRGVGCSASRLETILETELADFSVATDTTKQRL